MPNVECVWQVAVIDGKSTVRLCYVDREHPIPCDKEACRKKPDTKYVRCRVSHDIDTSPTRNIQAGEKVEETKRRYRR